MEDRIAYLIAAHSDLIHLKRLISALDFQADFFIHIDRKSEMDLSDPLFLQSNVYLLSGKDRIKVYWAGFSQVNATLKLIEKCLQVSAEKNIKYLKAVFFSGACYPIKNNKEIHRFFQDKRGVNFIKGMDVTTPNHYKYNYSLKHYHYFDMFLLSKFATRIIRKILYFSTYIFIKPNYYVNEQGEKKIIYHGSSWWAINQDVLEYIRRFSKDEARLSKYFKYTMAADEKFFHTIFFNSPFSRSNISAGPDAFKPSTAAFANLHIIDTSLTKWFTEDDYGSILKSDKLFVRKVSTQHSKALLDKIDRNLLK